VQVLHLINLASGAPSIRAVSPDRGNRRFINRFCPTTDSDAIEAAFGHGICNLDGRDLEITGKGKRT
jgi:hypothetical protein